MAQIRQAVRVVPSNFFAMFPEHEHNALDEHQALVAALADRDVDKARHIAERHVLMRADRWPNGWSKRGTRVAPDL